MATRLITRDDVLHDGRLQLTVSSPSLLHSHADRCRPNMLKRGFQFAPGYRLQEFLGRGQFGQVWRATAPGGAAAAVKFIDLSDGQGKKEYQGVRRVKQIRHANLMPITAIWLLDGEGQVIEEAPDDAVETLDFSSGQGDDKTPTSVVVEPSWLVVSMLLGGKSLQARLRECIDEGLPGVPPKELISYMDESAKGLDFLNSPQHDLGEGPIAIQHCDVKPANIVLIGSSAVVCDFGLARILTRNQVTATSTAGTPAYMAPEAISGKPSRSSDQYSLAVTYYHLRTGSLPVNDGSLWEVLDAHRQGNLKLGLVPESEQQVLRKATDLDWRQRFESNVEMVDALREALRAEGHTRPSFFPSSSATHDTAPHVAEDTAAGHAQDDPTATLDSTRINAPATIAPPPAQSHTATEPFVQAEQRTDRFLDTTLPELNESADTRPPTESVWDRIAGKPRLAAITAAVLVLLAFVMFGFFGGGGEPEKSNHDSNGLEMEETQSHNDDDDVETVQSDPELAAKLLGEAIATWDQNENTAKRLFIEAANLDSQPLLIKATELLGHTGSVMLAEISDEGTLATVADQPIVWDLTQSNPKPMALIGHQDVIEAIDISGDGRLVTAGFDEQPRVWNLSMDDVGSTALPLIGHADAVIGVAWHPSDPVVVTTSNDPSIGIWQLGRADADSPQGTIAKSGKFQTKDLMKLNAAAIDSQGRWFATIVDRVGDVPTAVAYRWSDLIGTFDREGSPEPITVSAGIKARQLAFAGDPGGNAMLVIGDEDGSVSIYELTDTPKLVGREHAHRGFVESIQVVRLTNADVIVSGSSDGSVHWWHSGAADQRQSRELSDRAISSVDVSTDGRWVAAGAYDQSVYLWDTSRSDAKPMRLNSESPVNVVLLDPTGRWLIAGCADGVVRIWDLRWAKLLAATEVAVSTIETDQPVERSEAAPLAASPGKPWLSRHIPLATIDETRRGPIFSSLD